MAIVGPFTSGVLGLMLLALAWVCGWVPRSQPATPGIALLVWLGYINLLLGAFNMIPGFPLDGGRVLHAILWWILGDAERSTRAAARIGQIIAVFFIGSGILQFFQGAALGGLWVAFIGGSFYRPPALPIYRFRPAPFFVACASRTSCLPITPRWIPTCPCSNSSTNNCSVLDGVASWLSRIRACWV